MNFLISTIVRNREKTLPVWYQQIKYLALNNPTDNFSLSIYQNDSTDASQSLLDGFDFSFLKDVKIQHEVLGTRYFGSVMSKERVENLAKARNKTLDVFTDLSLFDKIISIEPDVEYTDEVSKLLHSEYDIYSGYSRMRGGAVLYDTWATRALSDHHNWGGGVINNTIPVWSTFNCFCVYNAKPFSEGARFHWFNKRFNQYDCDTVVICEEFRERGYNLIYMNGSIKIEHVG